MGGNSSTPTRIENESTPLPISGKVKIAIACDASDGSGVRVYRFQGTRGELEEGVNWDKTEKEGMTIGQNRTLANFAQDAAAGEIMIICQFEIKLGNDEEDIAYDISRESTDKTMRLFIQKKMAASPQASETGRYKHLDITLRVITYNAHRSLQLSMKALVLSSPLFRMIHWPPAAVDFIMRKTMQSYVEAPSGDDPLRAIANNAGQHSSAESMSSYDIIQFMLAYVTDYAPPYMSVANTEDPQAMPQASPAPGRPPEGFQGVRPRLGCPGRAVPAESCSSWIPGCPCSNVMQVDSRPKAPPCDCPSVELPTPTPSPFSA